MTVEIASSVSNSTTQVYIFLTQHCGNRVGSAFDAVRAVYWGCNGGFHRLCGTLGCVTGSVALAILAVGLLLVSESIELTSAAWSGFGVVVLSMVAVAYGLALVGHERLHEWAASRVGLPGVITYSGGLGGFAGHFSPNDRLYYGLGAREQFAVSIAPALGWLVAWSGLATALVVADAGVGSRVLVTVVSVFIWGPHPSDIQKATDIMLVGGHDLELGGDGHRWAEGVHL